MNSSQTLQKERYETDIVVIGGGGAGLAAAVAAAEKGARVILVEKGALGGTTAMAEGIFAAESHIQKQLRITTTRDQMFRIAMEYSHWNIDARIFRAFINKSADTIQWLEDKGIDFDGVPHLYPGQPLRTHHTMGGGGGAKIVKALRQSAEGLDVQIFTQCPAKKILTDEKGAITGIIAATKGKNIEITSKSVIIGSGGFGANHELLNNYCPKWHKNMYYVAVPTNTGDGLLMAMEIGADTAGMGNLLLHPQVFNGSRLVANAARHALCIWVNKSGQRFTDESNMLDFVNPIFNQRDKCTHSIFDNKMKDIIIEQASRKTKIDEHKHAGPSLQWSNLDEELRKEAEKGDVKIADSWDDMAQWIGADTEILKQTIEEYNSFCDNGYDAIFNRDRWSMQALRTPPYYGIRCYSCFLTTTGGIRINEYMQVLNNRDRPIPGLYAGGDCAGGWETDSYCMILAGHAMGFAINSGRIAGEQASNYVHQNPID